MLESSGSRWFLLEERFEGWRDDPVVKNSGYSLEDPESVFSTMLWLIDIYYSSSRGPDTFLWPASVGPRQKRYRDIHTCKQNTNLHSNNDKRDKEEEGKITVHGEASRE